MILLHSSNVDIQNISLSACRPYKDFGRGFYLTDIPERLSVWLRESPEYMEESRY